MEQVNTRPTIYDRLESAQIWTAKKIQAVGLSVQSYLHAVRNNPLFQHAGALVQNPEVQQYLATKAGEFIGRSPTATNMVMNTEAKLGAIQQNKAGKTVFEYVTAMPEMQRIRNATPLATHFLAGMRAQALAQEMV